MRLKIRVWVVRLTQTGCRFSSSSYGTSSEREYLPRSIAQIVCRLWPPLLARRHKPACSANPADSFCLAHVAIGNGFDRVAAIL